MTLDREAARALFDNAETTTLEPTPVTTARPIYVEPRTTAKTAPVAAPVEEESFLAGPSAFERMNSPKVRKGPDWRIVAPIGVAAVCAGAVALFALPQNNQTVEGRTVASSEIAPAPVTAPEPVTPPADLATADNTPAPAAAVAPAPAPVVQRAASRPAPVAARRAPARQVAAAPSAEDSATNVSAREPYVPTPTLGAPAAVTLTPTTPAPAPVVQPTPPVTEPEPQL